MDLDDDRASGKYEQARVDPGAMALATVAGAVAFILGPGEWDVIALIIGLMLLLILVAHHRPAPTERTPRALLLRGAFGATTGLALCIAIAPMIQFLIVEPYFHNEDWEGYSLDAWSTTVVLTPLWFLFTILIAVFEPRLARWLDRPRRNATSTD